MKGALQIRAEIERLELERIRAMERLDSFVDATVGRRITYRQLTA